MDVVEIRCSGGVAVVPLNVPRGMQIKNWRQGRFYEAPFLEYLREHYHGGTWIDAGSALGNHTLFMAKFCDCDKIVSIDPIRSSLQTQARILEMNGVQDRVHTIYTALSSWDGLGEMERFGPGVGHWQLIAGQSVPVSTLDSLGLENVTVLKLDIEGSELDALKGASTLLLQQQPAVFCECNYKREIAAISAYLKSLGYSKTKRGWHTMHEWII